MTQPQHRFIVFEGLDGAGTTTQAGMLHKYFTHETDKSFGTFEPTSEPTGSFIREILGGNAQSVSGQQFKPSERAMALLFASDRLAHSTVLDEQLKEGTVVCDRYVLSSLAYQTLDDAIDPEWVIEINSGCTIPDITLFLDVPVDTCLARIAARNESPSVYENKEYLDTIAANYVRLQSLYEKYFGKLVTIDGTMGVEDVHSAVIAAIR
jgi:dTMP kinase